MRTTFTRPGTCLSALIRPALIAPALTIAALMIAGLTAGCSSSPQHLTLTSSKQSRALSQNFTHAYYTRDRHGDLEFALVDGGASPVRQVMHVRVLWQPMRDMKADHTSASNATIHWYVMGNGADVLEYAGTGFVVLEPSDGGTDLTVRDASLHPVACRGELCDPVGPCGLSGTVHATENPRGVREALSDVRTSVATCNSLPKNAAVHAAPEAPSSSAR